MRISASSGALSGAHPTERTQGELVNAPPKPRTLWKVWDGPTSTGEALADEADPVGACQPERKIS